ncbi:MAG TPA: capsule assembly Wzi family protein, partial [Longimicrobiales bacterium]|nr:capsule assembly Wzi family protein [Longimicrobiales bacterium]
DNQLLGVFFRWKSAPAGFEVYGEWARDDHWGTWTQFLRNLDSSQAWGLGLQKLIRRGDNALRLSAEFTHLADALPVRIAGRGGPIAFYTNTSVRQGHTHRGQMLGAPIGTGGEALFVGGDYFWRAGRTSFSVERARYNEDAYTVSFAPTFRAGARDTEISVRGGHLATVGALSVDAEVGWSLRYNMNFLGLSSIEPGEPYRRDHNLSLRLGLRWTPPGGWP